MSPTTLRLPQLLVLSAEADIARPERGLRRFVRRSASLYGTRLLSCASAENDIEFGMSHQQEARSGGKNVSQARGPLRRRGSSCGTAASATRSATCAAEPSLPVAEAVNPVVTRVAASQPRRVAASLRPPETAADSAGDRLAAGLPLETVSVSQRQSRAVPARSPPLRVDSYRIPVSTERSRCPSTPAVTCTRVGRSPKPICGTGLIATV